jgi:hypothetical protein
VKKANSKKVLIVSEKFVLDAIDDGTVPDYLLKTKEANDDEEKIETTGAKSTGKRKRGAKDSRPAKSASIKEPEKESEKDSKKESKSAPMASNEEKEIPVEQKSSKSNESDKRDVEVVFSFDTTGSMYPCLTQVRREIQTCTERLFRDIPSIRIGILAHGDYCDEGQTYVTKHIDLTSNKEKIITFIQNVEQTGGGDSPECYELVLKQVRENFSWSENSKRVFVLIGDDVPHEVNDNPERLDWKKEVENCAAKEITIYAVQALDRSYATNFYFTCASKTGGPHLSLLQFNMINDLLMAICYHQSSASKMIELEGEIQKAGRYTRGVRQNFDRLLGRKSKGSDKPNLKAVPPSRFQVLNVDSNMQIKDFVNENGLSFNKGRGFYQFNKKEKIQKYKEIILMDKEGDLYEGAYARELLKIPKDEDVVISPGDCEDFDVFIQSTSWNRGLERGTKFLYEVEDWNKTA